MLLAVKGIVFAVSAVSLKFGVNALAEPGADAQGLGAKRVAYFIDDDVRHSVAGERALNSMRATAISTTLPRGDALQR